MYAFGAIKDHQVNSMLQKNGYEIKSCDIFYSHSSLWLVFMGLLLVNGGLAFFANFELWETYWYWTLVYFFLGYLVSSFFNNSLVFTSKQVIFINTSLFFGKFRYFNLSDIQKIKVGSNPKLWFVYLFMQGSTNYVEVETNNKYYRFYCLSIQEEAYDENFTEKTIEDLEHKISSLSIKL